MTRMTNGEMIQKVFDCEVCEPLPEDDIIHVIFPDKNDSAIGFDWSWWNMEYKEPTAKNDLGVDCISRDEVCRYVAEFVNHEFSTREEEELIDNIITGIERMPSVTPQPRKGHWIANAPQYDILNPQYFCSECGNAHTRTPYCEMCGAKMIEP